MPKLRLLTIPMSHYCEKTRWALDRLGLDYVEERHLQVFHYLRCYQLSRGPNVPVLIDGDTTVLDSTRIMQHLDRYATTETCLYPKPDQQTIAELEELFDETLGIESRRWVYFHALQTPRESIPTAAQGVPAWQSQIATLFYPLMKVFFEYKLDTREQSVNTGLQRARHVVEQVNQLLSDGRPFLVGARFTAADLTLAAMMAPYLLPPEYGIRLPKLDEISPAMRETVEEMRATRAGRHALHLFQTQRHINAATRDSEMAAQRA